MNRNEWIVMALAFVSGWYVQPFFGMARQWARYHRAQHERFAINAERLLKVEKSAQR